MRTNIDFKGGSLVRQVKRVERLAKLNDPAQSPNDINQKSQAEWLNFCKNGI